MNNRIGRTLLSVAVLAAASLPVASNARETPALDRCVQTFVKEVVPADHSVDIRHEDILASTTTLSSGRSRVELVARGEKRRKLFGRAACVMDQNGSIVAMYLYDDRGGLAGHSRPKVLIRNG